MKTLSAKTIVRATAPFGIQTFKLIASSQRFNGKLLESAAIARSISRDGTPLESLLAQASTNTRNSDVITFEFSGWGATGMDVEIKQIKDFQPSIPISVQPTSPLVKQNTVQLNPLFKTKISSLRRIAQFLLEEKRFNEARLAIEMIKEEEFYSYMKRPPLISAQKSILKNIIFNPNMNVLFDQNEKVSWKQTQECDLNYSELRKKIASLSEEAYRLENTLDSDENRIAEINSQLQCYGTAYQKTLETIFNRSSNVENEIRKYHPNLETLEAFQANLASLGTPKTPTVILYTLVLSDEYWLMLVTPKTIIAERSLLKSSEIIDKVQNFRDALQNTKIDPQPLAKELYKDLFLLPIAKDLEALKPRTIIWSLDRELRYLPLAALNDGKSYLVEKYNQVLYTAASPSRWEIDLPKKRTGVGFGVSSGASPLPAVDEELTGIFGTKTKPGFLVGEIYSNNFFTKDSLSRSINKPRDEDYLSLHLASHFTLQSGANNFLNSYLLIGNNEHLTINEIDKKFNVFNRVHLLVLSACSTAVTDDGKKKFGNGIEVESFGALAQEIRSQICIGNTLGC